jgi:hypothetical protein
MNVFKLRNFFTLRMIYAIILPSTSTTSSNTKIQLKANSPTYLDFIMHLYYTQFRRLVKRIYVPLPDVAGRNRLITHLMKKQVQGESKTST